MATDPVKALSQLDQPRTTVAGGSFSYMGKFGPNRDAEITQLDFETEQFVKQRQLQDLREGKPPPNPYADYFGAMSDFYNNQFDKQFSNTSKLMGLTNQYREKEGATQGQIDEQAFRRQSAQLEAQKYMQGRELDTRKFLATDAVQQNRDADLKRALSVMGGRPGLNFR